MKFFTIVSAAMLSVGLVSCEKKSGDESSNSGDNKGRELVMDSIKAHGGTEKWYGNGQLQFRWTYHMEDKDPVVVKDTVQTVDPKTLEVVHEVVGQDIRFGMNGGKAWILPKGAKYSPPPRFWSLTPFYFIGMPFVFNDPNANFEMLEKPMAFEGKDYTQVKVTYADAAGDTPDDYYVLLIDPETKLTKGAYYIVTSKLVAPNGPGPAKFITLDNLKDVDGVLLASGHRTFKLVDGKIGGQMRFSGVEGVKWLPRGTVDLGIPAGAEEL